MIECNPGKIWKTHYPRWPKNLFPEVFCIKFLHLISNGLNHLISNGLHRVNINSLT